MSLTIRPMTTEDRALLIDHWQQQWGSQFVVSRGVKYDAATLPCLVAVVEDGEAAGQIAGAATYHVDGTACELVTLDALIEGAGAGTALIDAVAAYARAGGCTRLWLITSNDNTHALRFYQKRGFILTALYPNAIAQARRLKPEIPLIGEDGIPIRDEIELELAL